ncbi:DNA ligase [Planosporangium thailandense]|uniref:DNA ligase (ATP) n=1 Tax=Planosporangium thailandense TaxID=765197 RepID=A0ABX0XTB7_9ACTN|nr:non-homologous end-joining DNA ligase [Planosporangium thailandense]NJC69256.1 DNA ligase [Planosporangium thailandense]
MLATAGALPTGPGWGYELKWDGVRAIAVCGGASARFYGRRGNDITAGYPELAGLADVGDAVLDGEIVVMDAAGRPSFRDLAERMHVRNHHKAARLAARVPVSFLIFDVLRLGGVDLLDVPYVERRALLEELDPAGERWLVPPAFDDGPATEAASREHGLEGVVAKRLAAPYRPGLRSPDWVKVKAEQTGDFVVGGWRPGVRAIGGLLVGVPGRDGVIFRGRVGGGISDGAHRQLLEVLRPLVVADPPFAQALPREDSRGAMWVRPQVVVEIRFAQRTLDGRLRFPRFLRLRPDKAPEDVVDE